MSLRGLLVRDRRFQPSDHLQVVRGPVRGRQIRRSRKRQRRPELVARPGIVEGRRHHAHDRERPSVHRGGRSDRRRRSAEPALPESMRQHHDRLATQGEFVRIERASDRRCHAEDLEEVRAHHLSDDELRFASSRERESGADVARHALECPRARPIVVEVQRGEPHRVARRIGRVHVEHEEEAVGVRIRQRPEQDGIDDAEHQRRDADAERQGKRGRQREAGGAEERPDGEAKILEHAFHGATGMPLVLVASGANCGENGTILAAAGISAVRCRERPSQLRTIARALPRPPRRSTRPTGS